jgi:hypothetical protein
MFINSGPGPSCTSYPEYILFNIMAEMWIGSVPSI